jgi:CPA2 family monovalent cation:H+ antiporter-2
VEPHGTDLVATIAIALGAAFVAGYLARLVSLPAIVGYLLAGVAVGPFTPGLVADPGSALQLAEVGVALLMFGVGLHFSLRDLARVYRAAVPGAIGQIAAATGLGTLAGLAFGWKLRSAIVLGLAISVGSTVVLVRALRHRGLVDTDAGRVAIGWLIVEDLFTVVALVLLPVLASATNGRPGATPVDVALQAGGAIGKAVVLTAVMVLVGSRFLPWLLARVEGEGSRELFTLAVLAIAVGIAFASAVIFDVSLALGAFLAGAVISGSRVGDRAAADVLPLTDVSADRRLHGPVLRVGRDAAGSGHLRAPPVPDPPGRRDRDRREVGRGPCCWCESFGVRRRWVEWSEPALLRSASFRSSSPKPGGR